MHINCSEFGLLGIYLVRGHSGCMEMLVAGSKAAKITPKSARILLYLNSSELSIFPAPSLQFLQNLINTTQIHSPPWGIKTIVLCVFFALIAEKKNFLSQNRTKSDLKSAIFVINHVFKTYRRVSCTKSSCSLPGWRPRQGEKGCRRARWAATCAFPTRAASTGCPAGAPERWH